VTLSPTVTVPEDSLAGSPLELQSPFKHTVRMRTSFNTLLESRLSAIGPQARGSSPAKLILTHDLPDSSASSDSLQDSLQYQSLNEETSGVRVHSEQFPFSEAPGLSESSIVVHFAQLYA
jgi:hypothetical protein